MTISSLSVSSIDSDDSMLIPFYKDATLEESSSSSEEDESDATLEDSSSSSEEDESDVKLIMTTSVTSPSLMSY